ncbi:MAG: RNA-binding protein [Candidatus Brocadiia bacterium]
MNIYCGNLAYEVTEEELKEGFGAFGHVDKVTIIMDKFTGKSKGFAFIEMPTAAEAQSAIANMNGKEIKGRALNVNEARPRPEGGSGGGRGFSDRGGNRDRR